MYIRVNLLNILWGVDKMTVKRNKNMAMLAIILCIFMISINILANTLPINGNTTAEVSDSYPNLFAPIGFTFSIWGVIYFFLIVYISFLIKNRKKLSSDYFELNKYFVLSSIFNMLWIFSWHYKKIGLSQIFIILLLITLFLVNREIKEKNILRKNKLAVIPFSIYFTWIVIASIANFMTFLVSINFNFFSLSESIFTSIVILISTIIILLILKWYFNFLFSVTAIWAIFGIFMKHISSTYFNFQYTNIIASCIISISLIIIYSFIRSREVIY